MGRGQRAPGRGTGRTEARQPVLVYATCRQEDGDAPDVIMGTFFIHNVPYTALIDVGSTHSYITCTVSETLGIMVESTMNEVTVLSPLGQSVRVNKLFRDVPLEVQETIFLADLMELSFGEFNLILGMDWLVKHQVNLDCASKQMISEQLRTFQTCFPMSYRGYLQTEKLSLGLSSCPEQLWCPSPLIESHRRS
ncbi:uncharacterized protein LOC108462116 [Gossypium arboreum]|uniref:uncharacterized protein LOC108462116 n=1 Tax=Gossypium arboreum TaxID=29729 RepID=UPI0008190DFB|nr:uncharacterized protein LOC108462116 [Gossypium arboreum]